MTCTCRMCRARRRRALARWALHVAFTLSVGASAFLVLVGLDRVRAGVVLVLSALALAINEATRFIVGDHRP